MVGQECEGGEEERIHRFFLLESDFYKILINCNKEPLRDKGFDDSAPIIIMTL